MELFRIHMYRWHLWYFKVVVGTSSYRKMHQFKKGVLSGLILILPRVALSPVRYPRFDIALDSHWHMNTSAMQ